MEGQSRVSGQRRAQQLQVAGSPLGHHDDSSLGLTASLGMTRVRGVSMRGGVHSMSFCPTGMLREARREGPSEESSRPYTERHHPGRNASLFREAWSPHWHPHAWYSLWSLAHLEEKSVTVRSLRGATTVPEDTPEAILEIGRDNA